MPKGNIKRRPTPTPARHFEKGERVGNMFNDVDIGIKKKNFERRKLVTDVCDICHKYIKIKKVLHLRRFGWRFICVDCKNKKFKGLNLKDKKLFVEFKPPKQ